MPTRVLNGDSSDFLELVGPTSPLDMAAEVKVDIAWGVVT
jgi:hypothetical protein